MKREKVGRLLLVSIFLLSMCMFSSSAIAYTRISTGGTAAASSYVSSGLKPAYAFDWSSSTNWVSYGTGSQWIRYKLPTARAVSAYQVWASSTGTYAPKAWYFQGYDGSSWVTLDTRTGQTSWSAKECRTFYISNTTVYQYYRLYITQSNPVYYKCSYRYLKSVSELALYTHSYPVVTFSASDTSIDIGESTTLSWAVYYSTERTIGVTCVDPVSSMSVSPTANTTYTLTGYGLEGNTTKTVTVKINPPDPEISISRSAIISGDSVTVNWSSTNVTSVSINQGVGTLYSNSTPVSSTSGQVTIAPTETTTYTITISGPGGNAAGTFTISVYPDELDSDSDGLPDWYEVYSYTDLTTQDISSGECDCE